MCASPTFGQHDLFHVGAMIGPHEESRAKTERIRLAVWLHAGFPIHTFVFAQQRTVEAGTNASDLVKEFT